MNIETRPGIIHYTGLTSASEIISEVVQNDNDPSLWIVQKEMVNHPDHYGGEDDPYEAIKVIEAWNLDFCLGNVVKYISRAGKKDDIIQDLEKARWYLDREIQTLRNTILK